MRRGGAAGVGLIPLRPDPAAATVALGGLLHRIYGAIHGYWTCPAAQVANGRADCLAEVRSGERWHELSLSAYVRRGALVFTTLTNRAAQTWIRRWSPYSRYFLVRYHEPAPGVASVNSPSSFDDWGWIAGQARGLKPGATRRVGANDGGPVNGFERLLVFTCSRHGGLTTCATPWATRCATGRRASRSGRPRERGGAPPRPRGPWGSRP